ncbi:NAD(P)H-hydrate dehydratase [soil metagenome]
MVLTCLQMQNAEKVAFAQGCCAGDLMAEAGLGIARVLQQFFPHPGHLVLYLGSGNNAGDALVAASHLHAAGWIISARLTGKVEDFKELPARHWRELNGKVTILDSAISIPESLGKIVLMDGIVGIGARGGLQGGAADLVREMNALRRCRHAFTVALDLPSGLDPGKGIPTEPCVEADMTVTIAYAKTALLTDQATPVVGRLAIAPLQKLLATGSDNTDQVLTSRLLLPQLPRRSFEFHKGLAGRVGIVAGSRGFLGAAVLCASGALRGGAGLVTLYVKEAIYPLLVTQVPSSVMVKVVRNYRDVLDDPLDALAIGPGLGFENQEEVRELMAIAKVPAVIDADALTILAQGGLEILQAGQTQKLLTPHPGEMARLLRATPEWSTLSRREQVVHFTDRYPGTVLLLKGARTVIGASRQPVSYNSTGHPGMATGGMGDVLTGLAAALAAQGVKLYHAACLAAWLSGRAAELALTCGHQSQESLTADDILNHLGMAFEDLKALAY